MLSRTKAIVATSFIYLVVDLVYIFTQKPLYDKAVLATQHAPMTTRPLFTALSYTCLIGGWAIIVPALIIYYSQLYPNISSYVVAAVVGLLYGLIVYGVFAFTNSAILSGWEGRVVWQDVAWGMTGSLLATMLYMLLADKAQ